MPRKPYQPRRGSVITGIRNPANAQPSPPAEYRPPKRRRTVGLNWQYDHMMAALSSAPTRRRPDTPVKRRKVSKSLSMPRESSLDPLSHAYIHSGDSGESDMPVRDVKTTTVHEPLPVWMVETFSETLEQDNPLRSLLPTRRSRRSPPFVSSANLATTFGSDDSTLYPRPATTHNTSSGKIAPFSRPGPASSVRVIHPSQSPITPQPPLAPQLFHVGQRSDPNHREIPPRLQLSPPPLPNQECSPFAFNARPADVTGDNAAELTDDVLDEYLDLASLSSDWLEDPSITVPAPSSTKSHSYFESEQRLIDSGPSTGYNAVEFRWDPFIRTDVSAVMPSTFELFNDVPNTSLSPTLPNNCLSPTLVNSVDNNRFKTPELADDSWTVHFSSPQMMTTPASSLEPFSPPKRVPFAPAPEIYISPLGSFTSSNVDTHSFK